MFRKPNPNYRKNRNNSGQGGPVNRSDNNNNRRNFRPQNQQNRQRNNNNNSNTNNNNNDQETNSLEGLSRKYDFLLEQHIIARKKYFEMYFRADKNQKIKLEKHLQSTMEQFYNFNKEINYSTKKQLDKRNGAHPFIDTYAKEHNLTISHHTEENLSERFTDPHRLPTQTGSSFKEDTEESVGTLEDYKKIKNL